MTGRSGEEDDFSEPVTIVCAFITPAKGIHWKGFPLAGLFESLGPMLQIFNKECRTHQSPTLLLKRGPFIPNVLYAIKVKDEDLRSVWWEADCI